MYALCDKDSEHDVDDLDRLVLGADVKRPHHIESIRDPKS